MILMMMPETYTSDDVSSLIEAYDIASERLCLDVADHEAQLQLCDIIFQIAHTCVAAQEDVVQRAVHLFQQHHELMQPQSKAH